MRSKISCSEPSDSASEKRSSCHLAMGCLLVNPMCRNCDASVGECDEFGRLEPKAATKNSRLRRAQADQEPRFPPDTAIYGRKRRVSRDYHGQVTTQTRTSPPLYFNHAGGSFTTTSTLDAVVKQLRLEQALGNSVVDLEIHRCFHSGTALSGPKMPCHYILRLLSSAPNRSAC